MVLFFFSGGTGALLLSARESAGVSEAEAKAEAEVLHGPEDSSEILLLSLHHW